MKSYVLLIAALVFILDRILKMLTAECCLWFFCIKQSFNKGAAFGILPGMTWLFVAAGIVVFALVAFFYLKIKNKKQKNLKFSLALIAAGTLGNLIDRLFYGYVIDMLSFTFMPRWHGFNVADAANIIGALLLLIYLLKKK